ncbi:glycoside hydrolase family 3 C-terminal domain-containing protein [Psychrosphaera sp. B3R10]|uniref:glycoside hydrolase family 3 C-terminal domain-containing protein n=1 Tax=unclassified Psychrosphaera TaxID=2641570 RepID=UPI001C080487|nr:MULTISPECIES: glycoside hydrolase family 3 C-terminal domain-containing protein [unclassified Psychrosphaera]MBU2883209.1 glycoside hydrolase family 3 C-terminal domain-containing protein [Psychrosphaera sp. I2R16]MBU2988665.1 glycoside hydrolase family 3 C-terminal domain-containing protein [Psychrosphaera sp. B3R10]
MKIKKTLILASLTSTILLSCSATDWLAKSEVQASTGKPTFAFQDENLSVEQRVNDLVSQMTLEEKVGQLFDKAPAIERLQVPAYKWWNEALHGVARAGTATVFPQAIGLAATFDEDLMLKVGTAISDEGRAKHHAFLAENNRSMYTGLTYWSPNINIFRDPRWGRGQETYGEDPYLTTRIAINFVNGLQGDDDKYLKSVATLKHYAVHSGPEVTRHSDDYAATPKDLSETYLSAFRDVISETNVASVMCAYNSVNGTPACGNNELIQNKLRTEFNFTGYIVSDCGAIADFYDRKSHNVVKTEAAAAAMAVKAGTDLNCGDHHGNTFSYLTEAVNSGLIDETEIDVAVKRLFEARFKLGMFDAKNNVPYSTIPLDVVGSQTHLSLSQQAAEKSLVLLKNDNLLPLKGNEKIALIGPNADNFMVLLGNYYGQPVNPITPKQALMKKLGAAQVKYTPGASLTGEVYTHFTPIPAEHFFHIDHSGLQQSGLIAEYYPDPHFNRQLAKRQIVENIDFNWQRSPINNAIEQEFSVRWRGQLKPSKTAEYQFKAHNLAFTIDGRSVNGVVKLNAGTTYEFNAESKISHYWHSNVIQPSASLSWLDHSRNLTEEALSAARDSDVVVFVGGISANLEGEEMPLAIDGFSHGDRTHINLPQSQEKLLKKLKQIGKPIVFVNMSGSAIALNWQDQNVDAIIQGFYPGEATGTALTRLLYGEFSPSGKLPITFYKSVTDLPAFNDYSMANRTYKYYEGDVLYPFGFGLSYADVKYKNLTHTLNEQSGELQLSVSLSNASDRATEEVVQVYFSMPDSPVKTPIRQLVSFKRVGLAGHSTQQVNITVPKNKLTYIDDAGFAQPYQGRLAVTVGAGQGIKISQDRFQTTELSLP